MHAQEIKVIDTFRANAISNITNPSYPGTAIIVCQMTAATANCYSETARVGIVQAV